LDQQADPAPWPADRLESADSGRPPDDGRAARFDPKRPFAGTFTLTDYAI